MKFQGQGIPRHFDQFNICPPLFIFLVLWFCIFHFLVQESYKFSF